MAKSRVLVVGVGAIGTVCAYNLEQGGQAEVTAVMRSNYDYLLENGISIESIDYHHEIKAWKPTAITKAIPDVSEKDAGSFDFILVTTKNIPDVSPTVADIIAPAITPGKTIIVLAQNGLNIEKPLIQRFPTNPILSSIVYTGASATSQGRVHQTDPDIQKIGPFFSPRVPTEVAENAARRYLSIYNPSGNPNITFDAYVARSRWRKLAYNSSFNPVSAIVQMDTSRMRMSKELIDGLVVPLILEIRAAAEARGIILQDDLVESVMQQDPIDAQFKPSMYQDVEKGNLMEIENILGEPLREGEKLGVPMPMLRTVYNIVKELQRKIKDAKGL